VADDDRLHLDLDVDVRGGELAGRVRCSERGEREFTGWLGLLSALDALLGTGDAGDPARR
jgi:hypothetical protein